MYKHFESLDYLLALASVRFLKPYIEELEENLKNEDDIIEAQINAWRLFDKYAFMHPYIFLNLFWGNIRNDLESILQEYLKMYPVFVEGSTLPCFTAPFSADVLRIEITSGFAVLLQKDGSAMMMRNM